MSDSMVFGLSNTTGTHDFVKPGEDYLTETQVEPVSILLGLPDQSM